MVAANTITLKMHGRRVYDEAVAGVGTLIPGHIASLDSSGELQPGPAILGNVEKIFVVEDGTRGYPDDIWDAYADGAIVPYVIAQRGDEVAGRLAIGQNVARGDNLISYGDGTLVSAASLVAANLLQVATAASASVVNTTTETAFNKTYVIPANTLKVGDVIRIRLHAVVDDNNSTDTLLIKLKIGTTVLCATAAVDVADNDVCIIDCLVVVRAIGASGKIVANSLQVLGPVATGTAKPYSLVETTLDTTAAATISATATWSVAHADNEVTLQSLVVNPQIVDEDEGSYFGAVGQATEALNNSAGSEAALISLRVF